MINRVAVTGLGIISPLGNTINDFWKSLKIGKKGIRKITKFYTSEYQVHIAGECDIDLDDYLDSKQLNKIDRLQLLQSLQLKKQLKTLDLI